MRSSSLESVIITKFQATKAYLGLDLTEAKYSISILPKMEKENLIVLISPSNLSSSEKKIKST
jgi:hypothetical protein